MQIYDGNTDFGVKVAMLNSYRYTISLFYCLYRPIKCLRTLVENKLSTNHIVRTLVENKTVKKAYYSTKFRPISPQVNLKVV